MPPKTRKTVSVDGQASLIEDAPKKAVKAAPKRGRKPLSDTNAQEEEKEVTVDAEGGQDWPDSLLKAVTLEKGQKTLVKTLCSNAEAAIEVCDVMLLRRALWTSSFVAIPEGRKFLAKALKKIGIQSACFLMKKAVAEGGVTKTTCNHYGELIQIAWKAVTKGDENKDTRLEIEREIITAIAHDAIFVCDPFAGKYASMLSVFGGLGQKDRTSYDNMLYRCFLPVLGRGLKAIHDQVRYRASCILLDFYPIICDDETAKAAFMDKQHEAFSSMLVDDCHAIRQEAATRVLKIIANFWPLLPNFNKKKWMTTIFDELSRDSVVDVRIGVLHGLRHMLIVPACLNVTEHAMKTVIPRTIHDKNDRVRLESIDLLRRLKGNRYIKFYDIVTIQQVMARLEVETSESVRIEIVKLIFRSFFPNDADQNEKMNRIAKLTGYGRFCSLNFHRLLYSTGMLTGEEAVEHLMFLSTAAYRFARNGFDAAEMSKLSLLNDSTCTITGDEEELSESDPRWSRAKIVVECVVVLYMVLRNEMEDPKHHKTKAKIEAVMIKIFRNMFRCFRNTSALGTAMMIGSLLPQQSLAREGITTTVLKLLKEKVDEAVIEPYLEATAQWDVTLIFKIIEDGFNVLDECHSAASPNPKKSKADDQPQLSPNERLGKALHYLKYLVSSTGTSTMIVAQHQFELEGFYKQLDTVRTLIEHRLDPDLTVSLRDEYLVDVFSMKQTLAVLILNGPKKPNEESLLLFVRELCVDADWFENKICHCPQEEDNIDFWYRLCESVLQKLVKILMSWNFADVPTVSKAPTFLRARADNSADDEPLVLDFISSTAAILANFCSGNTPIDLLPHVVNAAKQLHSVAPRTTATMIEILEYTPSWILKRIVAEDEMDQRRVAEAYLNLLRSFIDHPTFDLDKHLRCVAETCVRYMSALVGDEHVVADPRMHDYEIPDLISILFFKSVKKNTTLFRSFRTQLGALFCSSLLLQQENGENQPEVWMETLGACLQMAYMLDLDDPEGGKGRKGNQSEMKRLSQESQSMVQMLGERIQQVEDAAGEDAIDGFLLAQIKSLLP